ncbi:MAG TPA: diguanylate cyclase [Spirochaetales bacterium]|nr:diguanylate cyclase [Spirochaetales bacterium]HRY53090.1 diguanylate cyclase [Spirochaetia bacterium]HRZ65467.1 diguanylate cyclase [Spirochaetia bacterium]
MKKSPPARLPPAALVLGLALALPGAKAGAIALADPHSELELSAEAELLFDADPELGIEELSRPGSALPFSPVGERRIYVDPEAPVAWLRFRLEAGPEARSAQWLLEVQPSFSIILDRLDLYLPREGGGYEAIASGASLPAGPRELASRYYNFELPPEALRGGYCYLRLESSIAVEVRLIAWPALCQARRDSLYDVAFGLIYGALLAMLLYNVFLSFSLRDRAYAYYVLYVGSGILWQFMVQGHAKAILGNWPGWNEALMWVGVGGTLCWGGLFSLRFLSIGRSRPALFWPLLAATSLGAAAAAAGALGARNLAFSLSHIGGLALPLLTIAAAAVRRRQGYRPAAHYLVGWSFLAAGGLAFALMGLKLLGVSFWTVNGVAVGMVFQALLLSMAMGERVRQLRKEKELHQRNEARYRELSLTDPLTGLYNKRYFASKLESEAAHARRIGRPLSLVFLDLDDFKAVNDGRGHPFGDLVLAALAAELREALRDSDVACRYGGEEFAVIMPGAGLAEAAAAGERIRARVASRGLPPGERRPQALTISLGAAELAEGEGSEGLLARADAAMYEAKRQGKNRVVLATSGARRP